MIGTSLYSMAMPLIRYRISDSVEMRADGQRCECGRGFPICEKILGRSQDTITTPDGRMLTNIFILFDVLDGALWAQIIQETADHVVVRIVPGDKYSKTSEEVFIGQLRKILGKDMTAKIEYLGPQDLTALLKSKFKPVVVRSKD